MTQSFWTDRGGGGVGLGGQGRCERRIEVFVCENSKKKIWGGGRGGRVRGGQGRCEQRSEVFVKIQKKKKKLGWGSGRWGGDGVQWGGGGSGWM